MRYFYAPDSDAAHTASLVPPAQKAAPPQAYRIITPARDASDSEQGRIPDVRRLSLLLDLHGGISIFPKYAMAEEIATATLVESVALRFVLADGRRGVALWWDWRWHGVIVRELGVLSRERLDLLITTGSADVPLFTCGRCGREGLKRNKDESLRPHKRLNWHPPFREECK